MSDLVVCQTTTRQLVDRQPATHQPEGQRAWRGNPLGLSPKPQNTRKAKPESQKLSRRGWGLLILIAILLGASLAQAQLGFQNAPTVGPPSELVHAQAYLSVDPVQIGSRFDVALVIEIAEGWHINSYQPTQDTLIPTRLEVQLPPGFRAGPVHYPEGERVRLAFAGDQELRVYEGQVTLGFRVEVPKTVEPGEYTLALHLNYQGCSDTQCLLPASISVDVPVRVVGIDQPMRRIHEDIFAGLNLEPPTAPAGGGVSADSQVARWIEERGYVLTFLLLFVLGLGLNLTPCVFPMVPITVSFFGGQSEGNTRRTVTLAFAYVLGISLTISALGVLAALSGAMWGSALQNPIVLILVAGILILLALSLFGVYEFRMPHFLMNRSGGARVGGLGAFLMGLTMGIVAAPCIGPVILGLLVFVGQTANPMLGFWMFFVLAWGLGLPYLFLAVFSGSLHRLPQSGMWMITVRKIFGLVLLGMAVYFLQSLAPDAIRPYFLPGYFVLAGIYAGWMDRGRISATFRALKYALAVLVIGVGVWQLGHSSEAGKWPLYDPVAFAQARQEHRPILIDFFAEWCFACKELEGRTFADERVRQALKGYALFRVDLTRSNPQGEALKKQFDVRGLPTVIFLGPDGKERRSLRVEQFVPPEDFLERLRQFR